MNKKTRSCPLTIHFTAGVLAVSLLTCSAFASPVDWSDSFLLQTSGGLVNPAVLVGFNPQPEPPAYTSETQLSIVGGAAQLVVTDVSNPMVGLQNFQFLFGVAANAGPLRSFVVPSDPINDFRLDFSINTGGGPVDFSAIVDVQSSSGGRIAPGSEVAFNPQPEPPALGLGGFETYGLDFGLTSLSDVTLTLHILDAAGAQVDLRAIPEPAAIVLCSLAVGCWSLRRRY